MAITNGTNKSDLRFGVSDTALDGSSLEPPEGILGDPWLRARKLYELMPDAFDIRVEASKLGSM